MKTMISFTALYVLWLIFAMFQIDNNNFILYQEEVKYQVDELAQIAAMQFNEIDLSEGYITYDYERANQEIYNLLRLNYNLDENLVPTGIKFWQSNFEYYTYFFDEKGNVSVFKNGVLTNQYPYTYGYVFRESLNDFEHEILAPSVVCTLNVGEPNISSKFVRTSDVVRTGVYEYYERK